MYKIRISCTSDNELAFNNKPINKKSYKEIHDKLQPNNIDYIDSVIILHKKTKKKTKIFKLKTLEFLCNKEIGEYQFEELIQKMIKIGFYSKDNRPIQFIYIDNVFTTKYTYDFNSCKPTEVEPRKKNKNQSNYSQQYLYKKV